MALSAGLGMTAFFLFSPASARAGVIPAQERHPRAGGGGTCATHPGKVYEPGPEESRKEYADTLPVVK